MGRLLVPIILLLLLFAGYLIIRKPNVSVVDAHYDGNTAQVIVDELPFLKANKLHGGKATSKI